MSSCSNDDLVFSDPDTSSTNVSVTIRSGIYSPKYQSVGYGYDITDDYLGKTALKNQVVDLELFCFGPDSSRFIVRPPISEISQRSFYGATAYEYINEIIKNSNYSGSLAYGATEKAEVKSPNSKSFLKKLIPVSFSGSLKKSKSSISKTTYSSQYSIGRGDILVEKSMYTLDRTPDQLTDFLSKNFKEDLSLITADALILKYGTHVLLSVTSGGMYNVNYESAIISTSSYESKTNMIEGEVKGIFDKIGIGFTGSSSNTENTTTKATDTNWSYTIYARGGNTIGTSTTVGPGKDPNINVNFGAWMSSINDDNSVIVDVDWNAVYPIYEFIIDPIKKAQVETAFNDYIKVKQAEYLDISPVYRYFGTNGNDHHFTISIIEMNGTQGKPTWKYEGILGYVHKTQLPGTVPVYRYFDDSVKDHLFTISPIEMNGIYGKPPYWKYEGILGYAYEKQIPGTVPVYRYFDSCVNDHHYTTSETEMNGTYGNPPCWKFEKIAFYVFP